MEQLNKPTISPTRWLKSHWSYEQLKDKTVVAAFTTNDGLSYGGNGIIQVRSNPEGLLAVELVFTRHDSAYQRTDIIYFLSSRQLLCLEATSEGADTDYRFSGQLLPDNAPD